MVTGGPRGPDRVRPLREVLTATGAGLYLATHVAGPIPAETMAAVHESDELELRIGRVGPDRSDDLEQREKEARAVVAAALKTSPERVALSHGTPEAARAITLATLRAWTTDEPRILAVGGLADGVRAAITDAATATGAIVEPVPAVPRIVPGNVAMLAMAHVDGHGRVADTIAAADAAHQHGARLLLDASLSVGALPTDADTLRADAIIADTHHWLLGPEAVALAWLSPAMGESLPQAIRAASGPFGRGALLALARSVGWLLMYVELPWAIGRTADLADRLYEDLDAIDGVDVLADPSAHGALAAFRIRDWDAEAAADELGRSVFAIVDIDPDADVVRASVGAWNREEELDRFIGRVAELARHTPDTLPRKPSLTVISGPIEAPEDE